MDRLDTASYAGEFVYHFDYTLTGMRDLITEQRNSVTAWTSDYAYDAQDRVTSVTTPNGTVAYTYDPNGNRAAMTTPSGTTSYQYNGNDQLTQVTAPMGQTNLTYTNVGLPDTLTYPNGVVKDYGYDDRDRLTSLTYQDGMTTLASYNYTLDTVGNRTRVDELGGDYTTWGYDNQYRLTNETIHDGGNTLSSSYTYDDVGNRTSQTVNGQATTYSYNALDQMTQAVTGGVTTTYAYDGRGNLATTTTGSDVTTYTYDALDRLITAQVPGSSAAAYTYDPTGQRVRQTVGSDTTNYLWDELSAYGDVVRETNGTGTELASYTLADTQLLTQTRSGVTSYYLSDGQGSTRALLNGTGDLTDTYAYTAYGEIYNQTGSTLNNYLYTGQQFDSLTGLYSLRARYYDPGAGRFVSRDTYPINYRNPIELNRYGYTANNPVNGYDPTGLMTFKEWAYTNYTAAYVAVASLNPFTCTILDIFIEVVFDLGTDVDLGEMGFELPCTSDGGANTDDADAPCILCGDQDTPDITPNTSNHNNSSNNSSSSSSSSSSNNSSSSSSSDSSSSNNDSTGNKDTNGGDGSTNDQDGASSQDGDNGNGGTNTPSTGGGEFPGRHRYSDTVETWLDQNRGDGSRPSVEVVNELDRGLRLDRPNAPQFQGEPIKGRDLTVVHMDNLIKNLRVSINTTLRRDIELGRFDSIESQLALPRYRFLEDTRFNAARIILEEALRDPAIDRVGGQGTSSRLISELYETMSLYEY